MVHFLTLPAVNSFSHLVFFIFFFFKQIGLFRVEAVDFGTVRMRKMLPGKPAAYGKAREPDDLAFPWV